MDREILTHLPILLRVAASGGFAAAAAELGLSPSAVSHAVKAVEDRLGQPVFIRTTRSVALSEAGRALIGALGPALQQIGEAVEHFRAARGQASGQLRLNVPRVALPIAMTPVMAEMARRHPEIVVEVTSDDSLIDIVAKGYDAGVRLGAMIAADMVTVRLTPPFRAVMVASPDYLKVHGKPKRIADLARHNCIGYRLITSGAVYDWDLAEDGKDVSVSVTGTARVTDSLYARDLALGGVGIAYLFEPLVAADLKAGRLREVLPEAAIEEPGLFLYFPRRAGMMPKLRAFIDTARAVLKPTRG